MWTEGVSRWTDPNPFIHHLSLVSPNWEVAKSPSKHLKPNAGWTMALQDGYHRYYNIYSILLTPENGVVHLFLTWCKSPWSTSKIEIYCMYTHIYILYSIHHILYNVFNVRSSQTQRGQPSVICTKTGFRSGPSNQWYLQHKCWNSTQEVSSNQRVFDKPQFFVLECSWISVTPQNLQISILEDYSSRIQQWLVNIQ